MNPIIFQIIKNPFSFDQLKPEDRNADLALLAVSTNPWALKNIPKEYQTDLVCRIALQTECLLLKDIHEPTQSHYCYSIKNSCGKTFLLLNMIPSLDMNESLVLYIIRNITSGDMTTLLKKFSIESWTNQVIESIAGQLDRFDILIFGEFLYKLNVGMSVEFKKMLIKGTTFSLYNKRLDRHDFSDFTEDDVKECMLHVFNLPDSLKQKWSSCLELTLEEFYLCPNKCCALRLCKMPTVEMIMLCAKNNFWHTTRLCLDRNILTGELLTNIIQLCTEQMRFLSCEVDNVNNRLGQEYADKMNNIHISVEQLWLIVPLSKPFSEYLKNNNIYLRTYDNVLCYNSINGPNCKITNWTFAVELLNLKEKYGDTISFNFKNDNTFRFYTTFYTTYTDDGNVATKITKIKSVIILTSC